MLETIGGRKVVAAVITLIAALVVTAAKGDVPQHFMTLLQFLFGAFVVGNGVEHITDASKVKAQAKASVAVAATQSPVPSEAVVQKLDSNHAELTGAISQMAQSDAEAKMLLGNVAQMLGGIVKAYNIKMSQ